MIEDLLRRFVPEPWIGKLDFTTLKRLNASYVSEQLQIRESDTVWRLRLRGTRVHVYLLIEFQSRVNRFMALRQMAYVGLFYQHLVKQGDLAPGRRLPLVLTIVVYNGKVSWSAPRELAELICREPAGSETCAPQMGYHLVEVERYSLSELQGPNLVALLIRLERSRSRADLRQIVRELVNALQRPEDGGLRQAFVVWLQRVLLPGKGEEDIPELVDLEEFRTMLIDRVKEWETRIAKKSRNEGRRDLLLRLLEVKFGTVDALTRQRVLSAGPQLLLQWGERLVTAERLTDVFAV
jgi:hypothetical protein